MICYSTAKMLKLGNYTAFAETKVNGHFCALIVDGDCMHFALGTDGFIRISL